MSVVAFPLFNLSNVPEALRKLASDIERNPDIADRVIVVLGEPDGGVDYKAFGADPFTKAMAAGICYVAAHEIMGGMR